MVALQNSGATPYRVGWTLTDSLGKWVAGHWTISGIARRIHLSGMSGCQPDYPDHQPDYQLARPNYHPNPIKLQLVDDIQTATSLQTPNRH